VHYWDKVHPDTVSLSIGDEFDRVPKGLSFNIVSGTYPLYGRIITGTKRVSEHKLLVMLGDAEDYVGDTPSETSTIAVYGEIDVYVVENEFADLWLK